MDLALDLLAMDLTNDPDPVRYDGTPPRLERESVLLASLFDITGLMVRTVFADTGDDDAVFYYINDHLGTPQIIIDETGNIVWKGDYQPFGSVNAAVSDLGNNFRFAGQYYDQETGLHYNYHRYYDPSIGRYLTPDPIGLAGGINLYAYVFGNPINLIDPLGLEFSDIFPGIRMAIIEGAKGGIYAVGEAAKATYDIAVHGHPLAQTALGVAFVSETAPLLGATAISAFPAATTVAYNVAPHSEPIVDFTYGFFIETGPPKGWGYLSSGVLTLYDAIKKMVSDQKSSPCEK